MIKGLIFDFDGLMVDTETPGFQAYCEAYKELGQELAFGTWAATVGGAGDEQELDLYAQLERLSGRPVDREAMRVQCREREVVLRAAQPLLPGVLDYLDEAQRLGLKLGIASNSRRPWLEGDLKRLEVLDRFHHIACRDDVESPKPNAEVYLHVLQALEMEPHEAIALEDSPTGVAAAKAAGLFCVAVPNVFTAGRPLDAADLRLESLTDLSLRALIRRIEGQYGSGQAAAQ